MARNRSIHNPEIQQPAVPNSSRGKARRNNLLKTATRLFLKAGYGATSIDAVIQKCGGSKSTVYRYFPNKAGLFRAVIDSIVSGREPMDLDPALPVREVLIHFAEERMRVVFSRRHAALVRLIISERERFPDIARLYYERGPKLGHDVVVTYLKQLKNNHRLEVENANDAAHVFVSMLMHSWYIEQLYTPMPAPSPKAIRKRARWVVDEFLKRHVFDVE